MIKIIAILILIVFVSNLRADDIYTRNGIVFRNVKIVDTVDVYVRFNSSEGIKQIPLISIYKVETNNYGTEQKIFIERFPYDELSPTSKDSLLTKPFSISPRIQYSYPNLYLLPVSILAFGLSFDYFYTASEYQDILDASTPASQKILGFDYKKAKLRKQILGSIFLATGISLLPFTFERVEIRTDGQHLALIYSF
jgi:hypothetical protein